MAEGLKRIERIIYLILLVGGTGLEPVTPACEGRIMDGMGCPWLINLLKTNETYSLNGS